MDKLFKANYNAVSALLFGILFAGTLPQAASAQDSAQRIYQQASPAVFVVVLKDASGTPTSFGSAFLIGKGTLATNFHVVGSRSVFLSHDGVDIPARVEKTDTVNDLAVIHVDADLAANVLALSSQKASPGQNVFVIGNPEGLANSISTGIVSANRQLEGRPLLQITAPISHGSSGGPVLNASGEVIGISVGMLEEGQNLNFAVPVERLQALLDGTSADRAPMASLMQQVKALKADQANQKGAEWEAANKRIVAILRDVLIQAGGNEALLLNVATEAVDYDVDLALSAAADAFRRRSDAQSSFALGLALRKEALIAASNKASDVTQIATRARQCFQLSIKQTRKPIAEQYFYLGDVLEDLGSYGDAEANFIHAIKESEVPFSDLAVESIRALARVTFSERKFGESAAWFKVLTDRKLATAGDWGAEAERRFVLKSYKQAGDAYVLAAGLGKSWSNWCRAALSYSVTSRSDDALDSARNCIVEGANKSGPAQLLALGDSVAARILNARGVYSEALAYALEASRLAPADADFRDDQAEALIGLRRFPEAIDASKQAIRLSDGKFSYMHFHLGWSYLELQEWQFARQSFEKAAELEPTDTSAPYNVAVCLTNLGYRSDAVKWFAEVLRRDPRYPDRAEIVRRISTLRAGL